MSLKIGGEPRIGLGRDVDGGQCAAVAPHLEPVLDDGERHVGLGQDFGRRAQQVAAHSHQVDLAAAGRGRHGISRRLDTVGQDAIRGAVQPSDASNHQTVGPDALDVGPHGEKTPGEIGDLGLARGVLQHRLAIGERRRHQKIFGRPDRHRGEANDGAGEAGRGGGVDIASTELDARAKLGQALQMQIDRPRADGTAARHRDPGFPAAGQQRSQHEHRGPHLAHQVIRRGRASNFLCPQRQRGARPIAGGIAVEAAHTDAELIEQMGQRRDIGEIGHVVENQPLAGQ